MDIHTIQMHPYHTSEGSRSISLKKVRPLTERNDISNQKDWDILTLKPRIPDEGLIFFNERSAELIGFRKRPFPFQMDIHKIQMHPYHTSEGSRSRSIEVDFT